MISPSCAFVSDLLRLDFRPAVLFFGLLLTMAGPRAYPPLFIFFGSIDLASHVAEKQSVMLFRR